MSAYEHAHPLGFDDDDQQSAEPAEQTGGRLEKKWVVVWRTMGLLPAQIIAERLKNEGIPAVAVQEGAGRALGLTVGILGEGRVLVQQSDEATAREILEQEADDPLDHWET